MIIIYWIGIIIIIFVIFSLIKIQQLDEDDLPADRESIIHALSVLAIIGLFFFTTSKIFMNFRDSLENNSSFYFIK